LTKPNLALYSEQFDDSVWSKNNISVTQNATTSPDGTQNADKIVEDTATGGHSVYQAISVTSGAVYTLSIFAKAAERSRVWVDIYGGYNAAVFDLNSGTVIAVSSGVSAVMTSFGNGWWRCVVTATAPDPTAYINIGPTIGSTTNNSYTGNGTSGIYIWGAQFE
jgi:hypothetical protein